MLVRKEAGHLIPVWKPCCPTYLPPIFPPLPLPSHNAKSQRLTTNSNGTKPDAANAIRLGTRVLQSDLI